MPANGYLNSGRLRNRKRERFSGDFFSQKPQREESRHSFCGAFGLPEIFGCGFTGESGVAGDFGAAPGAADCAGLPEEAGAVGGL